MKTTFVSIVRFENETEKLFNAIYKNEIVKW
jgi:hypothetical protein